MKKIIIGIVAIFSLILIGRAFFYYISKYHEQSLQNGTALIIRKYLDWEVSVPIYYEIRRGPIQIFESTPIYFADPELIEKHKVIFEIQDYNDLNSFAIIIDGEPNTIYGIGNYKVNVYFPDYSRDFKLEEYHRIINSTLTEIRKMTGNSEIRLAGFNEKWVD